MIGKSFVKTALSKSFVRKKSSLVFVHEYLLKFNKTVSMKNKLTFSFSSPATNQPVFVFNSEKEPQLLNLQLQYRSQQNILVFQDKIKASTRVLQQMYIFKIFKVMETSPFNEQAYEQFFNLINKNLKRKSDNMLLLLGTIKERIARSHQASKNYKSAMKLLEESLEILQQCMVPQLMPYYSVFREYGLLHYGMGNLDRAREILTESVNVLEDFVSHSDDNVSTDHFCLKQATAYNVLAEIDKQNTKKWVEKALESWQSYGQNKCNLIEYAKTVSQNLNILLAADKQKGEAYYHFNLYKFETNQMKDLLKKAKSQVSSQGKNQ